MKLKGLKNIPMSDFPPLVTEGMANLTDVEIIYKLRATEYWGTGGAVRGSEEAETPQEAYEKYIQFRKDYPNCEINATQSIHYHFGAGVPISPKRLRQLASKR